MKPESEKKLVDLINNLIFNDSMKHIVSELQSILVCEQNDIKIGKVDLYKFTSKDKWRAVLNGVYHDQGWRVASDGRIMVAVKQEYEESKEGKIIAKDGSVIEGNYPKWRQVVPDVSEEWKTFKVDLKEITDLMREVKAHNKIYGKDSCLCSLNDNVWVRPELLMMYVSCLKEEGIYEIKYISSERSIVTKAENLQILLMPCWPPTQEELADQAKLYKTLHGVIGK